MTDAARVSAVAKHIRAALLEVGLPVEESPHLRETPLRFARWLISINEGREFTPTSFPSNGADQLVAVGSIPFHGVCAHHLLPYTGKAYVAYLPSERLIGLSKVARCVEWASVGPSIQEEVTQLVVDKMMSILQPRFVMCVTRARHSCMEVRGVKSHGAVTTCSAIRPVEFTNHPTLKDEAFRLWGGPWA